MININISENDLEPDTDKSDCEGCDGTGIRWPAQPLCLVPGIEGTSLVVIERCDTCEVYPDDLAAAVTLFENVKWVQCPNGGSHAVGDGRRNKAGLRNF